MTTVSPEYVGAVTSGDRARVLDVVVAGQGSKCTQGRQLIERMVAKSKETWGTSVNDLEIRDTYKRLQEIYSEEDTS
jgi:hypothetical protein